MTANVHARFQAGLPAFLAELSPREEMEWMAVHAGECADCGDLLSRSRARLAELGSSGVHIPMKMLSGFLLEPDQLTALERELVARHLKSCDSCRMDMEEMARAAGVPPRMKGPGTLGGGWSGVGVILVAIAVVAAVLVWRQGRHPPPTSAPPVAAIPPRNPEAALGGAPLLVFHEQVRAASRPAPASDTLGFGQRVVRVQLPALFLEPGTQVLVVASTTRGNEVARDTLAVEALDRPFDLAATIGPWNAGDYVLKVIPAAGRDTSATREFEFRLLPSP